MANVRPLSKELQQKAFDELNEDVSRIPDDIQAIREWLQQKNYITARTDDQSILTSLRGCKFSLERTKEKIESYYTMRTLLPEFFKNRDPFLPEVQEILKTGIFLPILNTRNPLAPRVCFIQCATYDPAKINKDDIVKVEFMIWDILQKEDDQMNICGMQIVAEYDGVKMAQLFSPTLLLKGLKFIQDCLPCRIKGLHILNMPSIMDNLFKWIKKILNEKLNSRLLAHNKSNYEHLYKAFSKEDIPKEYGGDGPSIQELTDFWKEKVESYVEWFKEDEKYCTDEKLRPGKPKSTQEMFGVEGVDGSFRKLNVD